MLYHLVGKTRRAPNKGALQRAIWFIQYDRDYHLPIRNASNAWNLDGEYFADETGILENQMNSKKCAHCGLVNFGNAELCGRCGLALDQISTAAALPTKTRTRTRWRRMMITPALIASILLIAYLSLLTTSHGVNSEQREAIDRAINVIERSGFTSDAFMLRHVANFRATDNWWNRWVGHETAYAATNFPFQVITLYPDFFNVPVDDVERAAILLHESYHLYGRGEAEAFRGAWRDKRRLGWIRAKYGESKVWRNVSEATGNYAPQFFQCGEDEHSDCLE
jgi:hypothetical protein